MTEKEEKLLSQVLHMVLSGQILIETLESMKSMPPLAKELKHKTKHHFNGLLKSVEGIIKRDEEMVYNYEQSFIINGGNAYTDFIKNIAQSKIDEFVIYSLFRDSMENDVTFKNYMKTKIKAFEKQCETFEV
ncbi:MAG: hypothetical protein N4A45_10410 [Flavobacteriales bacterium]|jgi:hypothetical protein|nr:hypothetical protein [Flavobacteriales bacterium]